MFNVLLWNMCFWDLQFALCFNFSTLYTTPQLYHKQGWNVSSKTPEQPYELATVTKVTSRARAEIILWPLNFHHSVSSESASSTAPFHLSCSVDRAGKARFWTTRSPRHQWHNTLGINEDGCLLFFFSYKWKSN